MAAAVGSTSYEEDLWDLQLAVSEASAIQQRPMSLDLEDMYFDCNDIPMDQANMPRAQPLIEIGETVAEEVEAIHKAEGAQHVSEDLSLNLRKGSPLRSCGLPSKSEITSGNSIYGRSYGCQH